MTHPHTACADRRRRRSNAFTLLSCAARLCWLDSSRLSTTLTTWLLRCCYYCDHFISSHLSFTTFYLHTHTPNKQDGKISDSFSMERGAEGGECTVTRQVPSFPPYSASRSMTLLSLSLPWRVVVSFVILLSFLFSYIHTKTYDFLCFPLCFFHTTRRIFNIGMIR
jgi:hypothetical protein